MRGEARSGGLRPRANVVDILDDENSDADDEELSERKRRRQQPPRTQSESIERPPPASQQPTRSSTLKRAEVKALFRDLATRPDLNASNCFAGDVEHEEARN
eukprot:1359894-Pleurochrysis_carterae.AAC.1